LLPRDNGDEFPGADPKPTGIATLTHNGFGRRRDGSIADVIKLPEPDIQAA
jgi:hypothetical protein